MRDLAKSITKDYHKKTEMMYSASKLRGRRQTKWMNLQLSLEWIQSCFIVDIVTLKSLSLVKVNYCYNGIDEIF